MHPCKLARDTLTQGKQWHWCFRYLLQFHSENHHRSMSTSTAQGVKHVPIGSIVSNINIYLATVQDLFSQALNEVSKVSTCWPSPSSNPVNAFFHLQIWFGSTLYLQAVLLMAFGTRYASLSISSFCCNDNKFSFSLNGLRSQKLFVKALDILQLKFFIENYGADVLLLQLVSRKNTCSPGLPSK